MSSDFKSDLKANFLGGLSAAATSLPLSMVFGVAAFASLGESYVAQGAIAGLYSAILGGVFAALFGGATALITTPTGAIAAAISSIIAAFLASPTLDGLEGNPAEIAATLGMLTIALSGLLQLGFGLLGGGKLIKFIPYPVTAGFANGAALLLIRGQIKPLLGVDRSLSFAAIFENLSGVSLVSLAVGGITIIVTVLALRRSKVIPPSLTGLIAGVAAYLALALVFDRSLISLADNHLILGPLPKSLPTPEGLLNVIELAPQISFQHIKLALMPAITLSLLGSISSLLAAVRADVMLKTRHNSRRELIGQGIANIISSSFNGVGVAGNVACTVANINNGGRTKLSALAHSLVLLLALLLLRPAVQYIPAAAIAGVLTVTGFRLFDTRSLTLFKSKVSRLDFLIVAIVTATTIVSGLVAAVSVGVLITLIIFVRGLVARSIIKRKYYGNAKRSKKVRTSKERELLQRHGGQIVVYELEGALFFGTSDQLLNEMTLDLETKHVIILDFKRVYSMDITATQLIRQIADRVKDKNSRLLLSYVDAKFDRGDVWKQLQEADVLDDIGLEKIFPDTDLALEWAEDALIQRLSVPSSKPAPSEAEGLGARLSPQEEKGTSLKEIVLFEDFSDDELKQIEPFIKFCAYKAGDVIFKEGDEGDTMYLIAAGNVSIRLQIEGESRTKRLTSFGAGAFFGEMALLEGRPRSATATAETDAQLIALTNADFIRFREQHTDLAAKLLLSMVKEISARLRITSEEVRVLEE